jgi:hypothetical protein
MSTRASYINKAADCLRAANKVRDPAERLTLVHIADRYVLLADYVAARQDQGTVRRSEEDSLGPQWVL